MRPLDRVRRLHTQRRNRRRQARLIDVARSELRRLKETPAEPDFYIEPVSGLASDAHDHSRRCYSCGAWHHRDECCSCGYLED